MCACRAQGSYVSLQYSHAPFDGSIAHVALSKRFHRSGEDTRAKREAPNWEWGIKIPPRARLQMCVSRTRRKQNRRSAPARCFQWVFRRRLIFKCAARRRKTRQPIGPPIWPRHSNGPIAGWYERSGNPTDSVGLDRVDCEYHTLPVSKVNSMLLHYLWSCRKSISTVFYSRFSFMKFLKIYNLRPFTILIFIL